MVRAVGWGHALDSRRCRPCDDSSLLVSEELLEVEYHFVLGIKIAFTIPVPEDVLAQYVSGDLACFVVGLPRRSRKIQILRVRGLLVDNSRLVNRFFNSYTTQVKQSRWEATYATYLG